MVRRALSKVAWVGRTVSIVFGLALVMALVVGVASAAFGGNLVLGVLTNAATKSTGLVGNVDGAAALRVSNPNAGTNDPARSASTASNATPWPRSRTLPPPSALA